VDQVARRSERQGRSVIDLALNIVLLVFVAATGIAAVWLRNLLASAMVLGIYSLLMAGLWVVLDAVDVAFTEAAVGAGVTTVLMLLAIALTGREEKRTRVRPVLPLAVSLATAGLLVYATLGMPEFGAAASPAQSHVAPYYLERGEAETGVPNVVTAVLAAYRGFDTLGEVTVIFTAGMGVLVLLGGAYRRRRVEAPDEPKGEEAK
jgi:multicomponent Na+:H+ antiporter subunit B